jgi:hypothetical protein
MCSRREVPVVVQEAPAGVGHIHQAVLYESDDEFVAIVVPFLEQGRDGDEPTLVVLNREAAQLVRAALGHTTGITFLGASDRPGNPASAIRYYVTSWPRIPLAGRGGSARWARSPIPASGIPGIPGHATKPIWVPLSAAQRRTSPVGLAEANVAPSGLKPTPQTELL